MATLEKLRERKRYDVRAQSEASKRLARIEELTAKADSGRRITFFERMEIFKAMEEEAARLAAKDEEVGLDDAELRAYRKIRAQLDEREAKREQQRQRDEAFRAKAAALAQ